MPTRPAATATPHEDIEIASRWSRVRHCWHRTWELWHRLQVNRQGKYSIERLQALDEYCRNTSLSRVLSVYFLTPLPSLLATLLIECMPLKDPYSAWRHDWALWIRIWLTLFFVSFGIVIVAMKTIVQLPLTRSKCLVIAIGTATGYVGMLRIVATHVVFPIPFSFVLCAVPTCVICFVVFVLVVGREPFRAASGVRPQLKWFFRFFTVQASLVIVYPGYNAVFVSVENKHKNALALALPIIKLVVKNGVSRSAMHLEDYLPQTVVFLVEVFNTLYLTVCMQNAGSMLTALLIVLLDFVQGVWALRGVHRRTKVVQEMVTAYAKLHATSSSNQQFDFLKIVLGICEQPMKLEVPELARIRLRACLRHSLSQRSLLTLAYLEKLNVYGDSSSTKYGTFQRGSRKNPTMRSRRSNSTILPMGASPRPVVERHSVSRLYDSISSVGRTDSSQARLRDAAARHKTRLLFQTLQMLFHCEYLVLVEYVKCFVPLMYIVHFLILSQLPNAAYYPSASSGIKGTVTNVLIYATVELISFAALHTMFKRNFRFSPLYQLAFVLENQFELVQGKLLIWIIILLQFQLRHFGTDFTFTFAWVSKTHLPPLSR
ncbi:hypothetical protein Gpo141_00011348 [Globisporangium polare]